MKLLQLIEELGLDIKSGEANPDKEVTGGYTSDLLSDVIANAEKDNIWITLQIHQNIAGVASLKELSGIIIVNGRKPEEDTLEKAETENILIMGTGLSAFEISGRIYKLLKD